MYEAKKSLGQNFLTDPSVANLMVEKLGTLTDKVVVEIGSGLGAVTDVLATQAEETAVEIFSVEIDERFVPKLEEMYSKNGGVHVIQANILDWLPSFTSQKNSKIIGSLPFYITSPIVHAAIKMQKLPETVVLLIQKEVAQKICGVAPDASYMSTFVQTFYDAEFVCEVPRNKFRPEPNVDGAIICLKQNGTVMSAELVTKYEGFLHRAFASPRKMLNKQFSLQELWDAGIDPTLRPQAVGVQRWLEFFRKVNTV
jgi:16S rRNA (adenine1518-N6/adenine1519-N6)-dimethyltransferase